jgi:tRNA U38,U39,U40 pseudouridine synthase TruA
LKVTGSKEVEDLRNKHISMMDWRKVEKDSEIRASCARDIWRYKLSTQLFCPGPVYLKEFRIKLIKR